MADGRSGQRLVTPADTKATERINLIRNLDQATTLGPRSDKKRVEKLAANIVIAWDVIQILRAGRPEEKGGSQDVYDTALAVHGGPEHDQQQAITAIDDAIIAGIRQLSGSLVMPTLWKKSFGTSHGKFQGTMQQIQSSLNRPDPEGYSEPYRAVRNEVADLYYATLRESQPPAVLTTVPTPTAETRVITGAPSEGVLRLPYEPFRADAIHRVRGKGKVGVFVVVRDLSPDQKASFASREDGDQFRGALALARGAELGLEPQHVGCDELRAALDLLTDAQLLDEGSSEHAILEQAKDLLDQNQRDAALAKLRQLGSLWNGYEELAQNATLVTVDEEMVTVFRGEAFLVYDFAGNMEDVINYAESGETDDVGRAVAQIVLGFHFDVLRGGAVKTEIVGDEAVSRERVGAGGYAVGLIPGIGGAFTWMGSVPTRAILHMDIGYRWVKLDEPIETTDLQGNVVKEEYVQEIFPYVGEWGLDFQHLGRGGWSSPLRWERAGFTFVSDDISSGTLYGSVSVPFTHNTTMSLRSFFMLLYSGFLGQWEAGKLDRYKPRIGVKAEPTLYGEIGNMLARAGLATTVYYNTDTKLWTVDVALKGEIALDPAVALTGEFGYFFPEAGGPELLRREGTGRGMAGLRWTPQAKARQKPKETTGVTAVTIDTKAQDELRVELTRALRFVETKSDEEINGEQGQILAKRLAAALDKAYMHLAPTEGIKLSEDYNIAMAELRAGHLREGLDTLSRMPEFR